MFYLLRALGWLLSRVPPGTALVRHVARFARPYESVLNALLTVGLLVLLNTTVVESYKVYSGSMADTLLEDERILANHFVHRIWPLRRGDIIVFDPPPIGQTTDRKAPLYVKRVVGLPGDTLEITDSGQLLVNGELLREPPIFAQVVYHRRGIFRDGARVRVPEGEVFVFGDNSTASSDSRVWGGVPVERIRGRAFFRFWPLGRLGFIRPAPRTRRAAQERAAYGATRCSEMSSYHTVPSVWRVSNTPARLALAGAVPRKTISRQS